MRSEGYYTWFVWLCVCVSVCVCVCLHWFSPYRDQAGVIKFWGPHAIAPRPHITGRLGPPSWTWGPHTFLTDSSVCLRDDRSISVCQCLSVSSVIKQVPNMPNHQRILEETEKESWFTNCDIFAYVKDSADYTKDENLNGVVVNAVEHWSPSYMQ